MAMLILGANQQDEMVRRSIGRRGSTGLKIIDAMPVAMAGWIMALNQTAVDLLTDVSGTPTASMQILYEVQEAAEYSLVAWDMK
jgi:hypothetical protein